MILGHKILGSGNVSVMLLHDWFSDCSSYDPLIPYLDLEYFKYTFVDLRGYGLSRNLPAIFNVEEAAADLIALADHLKWKTFHLIGHSMSGLIAQYAALRYGDRIKSIGAITPVPACGAKYPLPVMQFLEDAVKSDQDASARQIVSMLTGKRYLGKFLDYKVKKWREAASPEVKIAYLRMFSDTDFSSEVQGISIPFLVLVGGNDVQGHSEEMMRNTFLKWYPNTSLYIFPCCGHYPMQEMPVCFAETLEHFVKSIS